jgi:hypothetical protein
MSATISDHTYYELRYHCSSHHYPNLVHYGIMLRLETTTTTAFVNATHLTTPLIKSQVPKAVPEKSRTTPLAINDT